LAQKPKKTAKLFRGLSNDVFWVLMAVNEIFDTTHGVFLRPGKPRETNYSIIGCLALK
jgi:hypothetical protein